MVVASIAAVNDVASAASPPTERSKSPTTMTMVWAAATMIEERDGIEDIDEQVLLTQEGIGVQRAEEGDQGDQDEGPHERPQPTHVE